MKSILEEDAENNIFILMKMQVLNYHLTNFPPKWQGPQGGTYLCKHLYVNVYKHTPWTHV